jgi:hypothetical protein
MIPSAIKVIGHLRQTSPEDGGDDLASSAKIQLLVEYTSFGGRVIPGP